MAKRRKNDPTDKAIEAAWYKLANGVQVPILDIPAIFRECRKSILAGDQTVDAAVTDAIARYRVN